jgi:UDP-N-acetylglucosamine:LPS N-acetylglucosamine transferase
MHAQRVDIVSFQAGSGHVSAARALELALRACRPDWHVRVVDLLDVVAAHRPFWLVARVGIGYFNRMLERERVFDLRGLIRLSLLCHDLIRSRGIQQIGRFWAEQPPDVVVSVTPMYNEALSRAACTVNPAVRYVTVPVDFEEVMPRYWFTPRLDHHYLLGAAGLEAQARQAGVPAERRHRLSGMVVDPRFYTMPPTGTAEQFTRLGLDPSLPTGLVHFGARGSVLVREVARRIAGSDLELNLILLAGRSESVARELGAMRAPFPVRVLGYMNDTPIDYYGLATFTIGKPGTMTIVETLVAGAVPVVVKSRGMAPVQRGNENWLVTNGVGVVARDLDSVVPAIREVLGSRGRYQQQAAIRAGRGVFEAAEIVANLTTDAVP